MNIKDIVGILGDKLSHLIMGGVLGLSLCAWPVLALLAVCVAATAKELYDARHPESHTYSLMDGMYTLVGGVFGVLIGQIVLFSL